MSEDNEQNTLVEALPEEVFLNLRNWLGKDGRKFFGTCLKMTGTCSPVLKLNMKRSGGVPAHPVHFREGMAVRNFLRDQEGCRDWDYHELSNNWKHVVQRALS